MLSLFSADLLSQLADITAHVIDSTDDDLAHYPQARAGYIRKVFRLPKLPQEAQLKVEIIIKITTYSFERLDCNGGWRNGFLQWQQIPGTGRVYYELSQGLSRKMNCQDSTQNAYEEVLQGKHFMVNYDSGQPLVIYVPDESHFIVGPQHHTVYGESLDTSQERCDIQLTYRLWAASRVVDPTEAII